jgi:hypothetical protein
MDAYTLSELIALSPAERATLNCVKVHGQTRVTLEGLAAKLDARLCTKPPARVMPAHKKSYRASHTCAVFLCTDVG